VQDVDDAGEAGSSTDGHEEGNAAGAEGFADLAEDPKKVGVVGVHLGQRDQAAEAEASGLEVDPPGVDLDPRRRGDGQDDILDGRQRAQGMADEVGIAGRVNQVNLLARPLAVERVAVDREVPALFFVLGVGQAGAVVDRPPALGDSGGVEQGVGQAGLAGRSVTGQGNVADIGDVIRRGHGASPKMVMGLVSSPRPAIAAPSGWVGGMPRKGSGNRGSTGPAERCLQDRSPARSRASSSRKRPS
jgi:hypothetical protein